MAVGGIWAQENDDVIAAQRRRLKVKLAGWVECNRECGRIRLGNVERSFNLPRPRWRMGARLAHLRHGDTPDQPGIGVEGGVDFLVLAIPVASRTIGTRGEAARMQP